MALNAERQSMTGPASQAYLEITEVLALDLRRHIGGGYETDDETDQGIAELLAPLSHVDLRWVRAAFHWGLEAVVQRLVDLGVPRHEQSAIAVGDQHDPIAVLDGQTAANLIAYHADALHQIRDSARGHRVDGNALAASIDDFLAEMERLRAEAAAARRETPSEEG